MDAAEELLKLAREKFGKLTEAEEKLIRKTANSKVADYSTGDQEADDPTNASEWARDRVLKASRIEWFCTDKQASRLITYRGVQIKGACINEKLDLMFARVPFPLNFEQCKFTEHIDIRHARIIALNMSGTHTGSLSADGLMADGPVLLRKGFRAEGEVRLIGAEVGGCLDCDDGQFINKGGIALRGDGLKIVGSVYLRSGFKAEGKVRLFGATIGGSLDCRNGRFINESSEALVADGLDVRGSVFMNKGFKSEGEVRLFGATIRINLDCIKGQFINESKSALNADELKVSGGVYLSKGFRAEGIVSFVGATIDGYFSLWNVDSPGQMTLDLSSAKIGTLNDKEDGWPTPMHLVLHGLEYREISHESPRESKKRIEWIRRQKDFSPQPYEYLAKVLRESGEGAGARDVLVSKNKDKAKRSKTKLTFTEMCWYRFFGPLIGYGHKPWLAIPLAVALIIFSSVFFKEGYSHGLMTPPSESAFTKDKSGIPDHGNAIRRISNVHPVFNSLVYSIDVFVPVVDLHQVKYWFPNANRGSEIARTCSGTLCTGGVLLFWLWLETACGWILTTLFLVGLTGLIRT
jgi:hypothetical protein